MALLIFPWQEQRTRRRGPRRKCGSWQGLATGPAAIIPRRGRGGQGPAAHPLEQGAHDIALARVQRVYVQAKVENHVGPPAGKTGADTATALVSHLKSGRIAVWFWIHGRKPKCLHKPRQLGESDDLTARVRQCDIGDFRRWPPPQAQRGGGITSGTEQVTANRPEDTAAVYRPDRTIR